ncbi:hypothetical protein COU56_05025 [Candidatus Pacearchaeota archaeon CG10_big_fil_rev_8_21_14_0_10_31_9]|nr:MAG: hypothetical protein AUJ62_03500 [Candidatus Pacearchaeota archaeon CG1_02_32_21]PIN91640.1 MAG: hypothetical protein COU56_05025 [Candidatus Pacearchaeota archaeon CG10_big_fil_rev_8_21_14_0_10_31_9]
MVNADCNIYHKDCPPNPNVSDYNRFVFLSEHLGVDWKIVRDMYWSISVNDKKLVDEYIQDLRREDMSRYL